MLINPSCTGDYEMLAGNLASIGVGAIISTVVSFVVSCNESIVAFLRITHSSGPTILTLSLLAQLTGE